MIRRPIAPIIAVTAGSILLAVAATAVFHGPSGASADSRASAAQAAVGEIPANGTIAAAIAKAQAHLKEYPSDAATWAQLGAAYVQQARIVGDPSYYPKAEGTLRKSLAEQPTANIDALTGLGALADARHEFAGALQYARDAHTLDPFNATAYGVEDDALTQLGDYAGAQKAAQKMLDLAPGVSSFTRASYHFEETGDVASARSALEQALADAGDPSDVAYCRYYLGELDFNSGDPVAALKQYALGLTADASSDQLLAGRAKSEAATGESAAASTDYATVISRVPQPQYVLEYAELLQSLGRPSEAAQQLSLLASELKLLAANGVVDDLTASVVAADHGSAADAVTHARAEWSRRQSVLVADALAWALHRDGKDTEALGFAEKADRLGWRNATFSYHRGMIELALGHRAEARRQLQRAMAINPYFNLIQAGEAKKALLSLQTKTGG